MHFIIKNKKFQLISGLLLLLLITRGHSLGDIIDLPDATLAVFFIGGVYLRKYLYAPIFFFAAFLSDNHAFANGVSDHCYTPAYLFLIPTYMTLWVAGRRFQSLKLESLKHCITMAWTLALATSIAFILSSGSFSFLSGYYDHLTISEHIARSSPYYIPYLLNTLIYMAGIIFVFNTKTYFVHSDGLQES